MRVVVCGITVEEGTASKLKTALTLGWEMKKQRIRLCHLYDIKTGEKNVSTD